MREIHGDAKTVRDLLKGVKYSIDYYQREYKWGGKQLRELIDDLSGKFLEVHKPGNDRKKVSEYPHYFLGSIIISKKESANYVVDGQQRLTTLTLLLIYLRNLQRERDDKVSIDELVASETYGEQSFNIEVDERIPVMDALFSNKSFDATDRSESVQNILKRYEELDDAFPEELREDALPYFIDWLQQNVHFVEITAYSDDDAYTIFETMNDRGLSLSPTDMLKGYLLANVDRSKRNTANDFWRKRMSELTDVGKEAEADFFKAWLRSQYATKIRERKRGATPEDFDRIGTEFHRWLRDASKKIGLEQDDDFYQLIDRNLNFYSRQYLELMRASREPVEGLEHVLYNAHHGFTLQYMLLLAPLTPDDTDEVARQKQRLVGQFVDILITRRIWNFRSISYSTMQYAMFLVMRSIRGLEPDQLGETLKKALGEQDETFSTQEDLYLHQQNRRALHRVLARLADSVEVGSGQPTQYMNFVSDTGKDRFEVEHIWADKYDRHKEAFAHPKDFADYRNRIGGLLLLPKSFNASYGDLAYEKKLPHYLTQNLLARSLHPQCYERNPGFIKFVKETGLPFRAHEKFTKEDLDARGALYRQLAEYVWNPNKLIGDDVSGS
ncbi:MAG: DUF262 domain-containing protein [Patescibacteria group bacterium]